MLDESMLDESIFDLSMLMAGVTDAIVGCDWRMLRTQTGISHHRNANIVTTHILNKID